MMSLGKKLMVPRLELPPEQEEGPFTQPTCEHLPAWYYDQHQHAWVECAGEDQQDGDVCALTSLRLVTYNVYFGERARRARFRHILGLLASVDADVVCIQEATMDWIEEMTDCAYIQKHYYVSDVTGQTLSSGYGIVMLSRLRIARFSLWKLPTNMGRHLLLANYNINQEAVCIGTVHLESLDSAPMRTKQLECISEILKPSPHAGLLGDFNFDPERNYREDDQPLENLNINRLLPEYSDVWASLRKGYTMNYEINKLVPKQEQFRFDRILWRSSLSKWMPMTISLMGTEPVEDVWPSDHFGLIVELASRS